MILKMCSRCRKMIQAGTKCECELAAASAYKTKRTREYDRLRRDKRSAAFYNGQKWRHLSNTIKAKCNGIDIYIWYTEGRIVPGDIVHHIIPIKDDWENRYNDRDLILLSGKTHEYVHEEYKNGNKEEMQKTLRAALDAWHRGSRKVSDD